MSSNLTFTEILNQLEMELNEIKRQKRSDLNFYNYSNCDYYDNQILELNKKIKKIIDDHKKNIRNKFPPMSESMFENRATLDKNKEDDFGFNIS